MYVLFVLFTFKFLSFQAIIPEEENVIKCVIYVLLIFVFDHYKLLGRCILRLVDVSVKVIDGHLLN